MDFGTLLYLKLIYTYKFRSDIIDNLYVIKYFIKIIIKHIRSL